MDKKVTADTRELPDISQEFKAKKDGDGRLMICRPR